MSWHSALSPEAGKALSAAAGRSAMFVPRLKRTNGKLLVLRPHSGNRGAFAQFMAQRLPMFTFDSRYNWWSAELTLENYEAAMQTGAWKVSDGVREWVDGKEA